MTWSSTSATKPKSRNTKPPSREVSNKMLPSCGSACTNPVYVSCATHASTAICAITSLFSGGKSEMCFPSIHSVVSTRAEPGRPVNSGYHFGARTNPNQSCLLLNSSMFLASLT